MGTANLLRKRLVSAHRTAAVICFNALLLLIVINFLAWGYLKAKRQWGNMATPAIAKLGWNEYDPALSSAYEGLSAEEVAQVRKETRRLYQGYEDCTQFKESTYGSKFVNVHSAGFRVSKDQGRWPPPGEQLTVFLFGGSTVFGYGVSDRHTIASQLQDAIATRRGVPCKVYNFGRAYYISVQERILLEKLILQGVRPQIAIFIDGVNDLYSYAGELHYTDILTKFMAEGDQYCQRKVVRGLPAGRIFADLAPRAVHAGAGNMCPEEESNARSVETRTKLALDRYIANKKMIEAVAANFGVTPVFVWQPVAVHEYDIEHHIFKHCDYDAIIPCLRPGYAQMSKIVKTGSLGGNFLWLADMQKGLKKPLYVSKFHYSPEMCRRIADSIYAEMEKRNLLILN